MSVSTNDLKNGMSLDLPAEGLVTVDEGIRLTTRASSWPSAPCAATDWPSGS